MIFPPVFTGLRFAVLGLGKAGLPAALALRVMGAEVFAWDDAPASREAAVGVTIMRPSEAALPLDALVLSPGIAHKLPRPHVEAAWALAHGVPILTDAELLFRAVRAAGSRARFAGITGTNGKSTTTALLAHILTMAGVPNVAGANLGPAALALPLLPDNGVYVLEMSSYMLERIDDLRFDVAVMLNLSPDHLDRHGDMEGYAAAKQRIFINQDADCVAVVGVDDAPSRRTAAWLEKQGAPVTRISETEFVMHGSEALPGAHNAQNARAATVMALALGVSEVVILQSVASFPGLPHRQAEIAVIDGVRFINDSKATNADATARAMECYDKFIWIAGGVAKAGGVTMLARFFPKIKKAFLIGKDGAAFAEVLSSDGVANDNVLTLEAAVPMAYAEARKIGCEVILFSPAAASFDQFDNFEHRGDVFTALARGIK